MKVALIKDGKIANLIKASPEHIEAIRGDWDEAVEVGSETLFIGQDYENGAFIQPPPPPDTRTWREKRRDEYPPIHDIVEALIEKEMGRPEKLELMKSQRQAVIDKYPKE